MNEAEICYLGFYLFRFDGRKKWKWCHKKMGIVQQSHVRRLALVRIIFITPSTCHWRTFFWNSFLPHPSMFVFLVFFIDNYFGSFRHQSSRFFFMFKHHTGCLRKSSRDQKFETPRGRKKSFNSACYTFFYFFLFFHSVIVNP